MLWHVHARQHSRPTAGQWRLLQAGCCSLCFPAAIPPAWSFVETFLFSSFLDPFFSRYISNTFFFYLFMIFKTSTKSPRVCVLWQCPILYPRQASSLGKSSCLYLSSVGVQVWASAPSWMPKCSCRFVCWCLVWPVATSWVTGALAVSYLFILVLVMI